MRPADEEISYRWVADADGLSDVIGELLGVDAFGIDTEFHRERTYWPKLALVQLAWERQGRSEVALVDALAVDVAPLAEVFASSALAIIHAAAQDLEIFARDMDAVPERIFDTQIAAGFIGLGTPSLANLLRSVIDVNLPKADRLTDWLRRPLGAAAKEYAAADVAYLIDLYEGLSARLREAGREAWAREECEEFRLRPRLAQDPDSAWWRLKGNRQLRGASRGVAQAVAAWRERSAAERDKPTRLILSDLAIMGIAHKPPTTRKDLGRVRGLDGRHLKSGADQEILDAVQTGLDMTKAQIKTPEVRRDEPPPRPLTTFCAAYVAQVAEDRDLDAALLATRDDIVAFLRGDDDADLRHGWRYRLAGAELEQLLAGDVAMVADSDGKLKTLVPRV